MSLKEINELNFSILTLRDLETLYRRYGAYPVIHNGAIERFTNAANELIEEAKSLPPGMVTK